MAELKPCKTGNYKHGYSVTHPKLFLVWETMRNRCNNPHRKKYNDYGGCGISVCKEWDEDCEAFCKWALENGYKDGLQIENLPAADVVKVVRCKDCRHRDPEDRKCDSGEMERQGCVFPVDDDYFCAYGER